MNDTTIYVGTYIKATMPKRKVQSRMKVCPVCTYTSGIYDFCPHHGNAMTQFHETRFSHPYDMLLELFKGDGDRFSSEFFGDYEDGEVCFMPNQGQGGRYIHTDDDAEIEIPPYNLEGDWQELITYLLEHEVQHEVVYGILVIGEK